MTAPPKAHPNLLNRLAGLALTLLVVAVLALVWLQFRGQLTPRQQLTVISSRAGLVMNPGSKVTYNGMQIGRVRSVDEVTLRGQPRAKITVVVEPKYLSTIPSNVVVDVTASTLFGNKYLAFTSPKNPTPQSVTAADVLDASSVTTEFNTLFENILSLAQKVDPVKLNLTLSATAEALDGLGDRFGRSLVDANNILGAVNPRMTQVGKDTRKLADLAEIYANSAPNLFDGLHDAVTTVRTVNQQQHYLDQTLMAAIGFGNTGGDVIERGGPNLVRALQDLIPTSVLLDRYSPALYCTIRNFHDVAPKISAALGRNGYAATTATELLGAANPYVYPDNLPRTNAHGGPGGQPGCWQKISRDLWPAPYLVMDTGASIAPYNHFEIGQPLLVEHVWGRQFGENTINP